MVGCGIVAGWSVDRHKAHPSPLGDTCRRRRLRQPGHGHPDRPGTTEGWPLGDTCSRRRLRRLGQRPRLRTAFL